MISSAFFLLVEIDTQDLIPAWKRTEVSHHEYFLVIGAMVTVTVILMFWATFVRKRRRRHKYKYPHNPGKVERQAGTAGTTAPQTKSGSKSKRRRRSRRSERRNPTLAETGGLPPVRNEWPEQES